MDHYQKQADIMNSIKWCGKPIFNVSAEYIMMQDELMGFPSRKKLKDMIGKTT